ncbi:MAG: hypothetical protein EAY75_15900 [Bacteroidetes bacterium]|nr:MAG: hypothetical protein EAY75_15900 [Bacteroidota bacterium]
MLPASVFYPKKGTPLRITLSLALLFWLAGTTSQAQTAPAICAELDFYWHQLSVDCKGIAGTFISTVKEYRTRQAMTGMQRGQCSGKLPYSNDFVKFYSVLRGPQQADSAWLQWRNQLATCFAPAPWVKLTDAQVAPAMRQIRWQCRQTNYTRVVILEEIPDADTDAVVITLEMIRVVL